MKHPFLILTLITLLAAGCTKEKNQPTDAPDEDVKIPSDTTHTQTTRWTTFNISNSPLNSNQVNAIAIDKNDVKWIGTANGLYRLNGGKWTTFTPANSQLPSANIQALATEANGSLWVGTDKGIAKFDGTHWQVYNSANSVFTNNNIKCIAHDANRQITWIGTDDGFVKVTGTNQWEHLDGPDVILSMAVDHDGALWIGTFNSFAFIGIIKKYHNGQWTSYRLDQMGYTSAFPYGLVINSANQIYAVLGGTVAKSVICFDGQSWKEITKPENVRGLKTIALEGNKIWVGGIHLSEFGHKDSKLLSIPDTDSPIQCIATDNDDRKWLGTVYGGLAVYGKAVAD
ncbi:ligand-binding sensor domain-containing protein [Mucilaginibacter lacusdianchii]|uniref:ligand-binding sensor domain-containing protein n=1 Tax=Mucilaginibacter lacusdianchii TaxID=2684211 RepID=UPI00131BB5A4|nr:two-component regulator propeller domain-containing protein [Mucilaginibacter sp. JXJ CY 39]